MGGVYFAYMGRRNPLTDCVRFFLVKDIHDVITHAKFGDDRLRGLGVVAGQISAFPIDFAGRPYNTLTLPCERVISPSQFLLRTCSSLQNSFSEDRANFSCLHIIFKSSLKSTNLMSLVHWSLYVPSLCYYVHGYFCVCMFQWATVGADIECSTMFLLCFYCLCLRMLSK